MKYNQFLAGNPGKTVRIAAGAEVLDRFTIRTHFITFGEDLSSNIETRFSLTINRVTFCPWLKKKC